MAYSEAQISEALAAVAACGGDYSKARRALRGAGWSPVPAVSTLSKWASAEEAPATERQAAISEKAKSKKDGLADRLDALAHVLIDDLMQDAKRAGSVNQVATALGIAIDKARLVRGESTQITESRTEQAQERVFDRLDRIASARTN